MHVECCILSPEMLLHLNSIFLRKNNKVVKPDPDPDPDPASVQLMSRDYARSASMVHWWWYIRILTHDVSFLACCGGSRCRSY